MSNAVSNEHTVMLAFEDANVADVTMPGSRGCHSLTHDAQLPSVVLQKQPNSNPLILEYKSRFKLAQKHQNFNYLLKPVNPAVINWYKASG